MANVIDQFAAALAARGILAEQIEADGALHRCKVEGGKPGREDAAYVLHLDGVPAGGFINWRDGQGWQAWAARLEHKPSDEDRAIHRTNIEKIRETRHQEELQRHAENAKRARRLLDVCKPATNDHPYLLRKGVKAYGLHLLRGQLVIPLRDLYSALWSLQFIDADGNKRFLSGGRKRGCYYAIGKPRDVLCLAEGYATCASIFEATGYATACCFDAGNLEPVARALRAKFPRLTLIICADNDIATPGNPGVSYAIAAARAVGGRVAIPSFLGVA